MFKGVFNYLGRALAIGAAEQSAPKEYLREAGALAERVELAPEQTHTAFAPAALNQEPHVDLDDNRVITLGTIPPFRFRLHPQGKDDCISPAIRLHGVWEPLETEISLRLLPIFDCFLDLGANIGWYTVIAREIMRQGATIHAFEPDPGNYSLLQENVGHSVKLGLHCVAAAVSDAVGTAHLYHAPTNLGDHRLYASKEERPGIEVPVTTLDAYFAGRALPSRLVKMDTQGSEPRIFRGAKATLQDGDRASAYITEFWPYGMSEANEDIGAYISLLSTFSQKPFVIDHASYVLRSICWNELRHRSCEGELRPETREFVDLLMVTPGSAAHLAVIDLISPA